MGIVDLFEPETAALSRMTRASNVALNDIVHQVNTFRLNSKVIVAWQDAMKGKR